MCFFNSSPNNRDTLVYMDGHKAEHKLLAHPWWWHRRVFSWALLSLSGEEGVWCIPARIRSSPLLLLFFSSPLLSSHPSTRESCSPPSAHSSSRTVSTLWRRTEAVGRWQSRALNARHLDGNPRVKPGETGRALCCDAIPCMLTIREVCTVNRLNVSSQRLQRGLSLDALVICLKSCVILAFCEAGRSFNKGLPPLLVMWSFWTGFSEEDSKMMPLLYWTIAYTCNVSAGKLTYFTYNGEQRWYLTHIYLIYCTKHAFSWCVSPPRVMVSRAE